MKVVKENIIDPVANVLKKTILNPIKWILKKTFGLLGKGLVGVLTSPLQLISAIGHAADRYNTHAEIRHEKRNRGKEYDKAHKDDGTWNKKDRKNAQKMSKEEKKAREAAFAGYQVNKELMAVAKPNAMVQHCLPAYREQEITTEVFEEHADEIFDEAENRLHAQKAVLVKLLG